MGDLKLTPALEDDDETVRGFVYDSCGLLLPEGIGVG
jgi:hypothetical protein